ncbi:MAG: hypothetical protein A2X59_04620 [Nitrospirae bacterium GWC2_42_7]|nr:MAG: hypothetical protein A2X59_04620 [Nitrospirae bacterium GWC2_42_7]
MDIAKIRKKMQQRDKEASLPGPEKQAIPEEQLTEEITEEPQVMPEEQETDETKAVAEVKTSGVEEKAVEKVYEKDKMDDDNDAMLELLTFSISNEEFAFRVPEVEEILRFQNITRVPTMPDYVLGITSLRGKIIPVIDLETRLGIKNKSAVIADEHTEKTPETEQTSNKKILIVDGPKGMIGAVIDRVEGVIKIPQNEILTPPGHLTEEELKFLEGVVIFEKRFISMIRAEDTLKIDIS